jgi:hypothetical protein
MNGNPRTREHDTQHGRPAGQTLAKNRRAPACGYKLNATAKLNFNEAAALALRKAKREIYPAGMRAQTSMRPQYWRCGKRDRFWQREGLVLEMPDKLAHSGAERR